MQDLVPEGEKNRYWLVHWLP